MKFDRIAICAQLLLNATLLGLFSASEAAATGAVLPTGTVIEYYDPDLQDYFITGDPVEQAFVDTGAVGLWQRTGNAFETGGPNQVCRFYGNANINPATGNIYGPNSHFYTVDANECAGLKALYNPNAKSWKFESNDFSTTPVVSGGCPGGLVPVYRTYNNGFAKGIDSNHRITTNFADYQSTVAGGWVGEGIVMCAPPGPIRRPQGIYAKVNIATEITQQQRANPSITPTGLNAYFDSLYQGLLNDPAISGLALQVHWSTLNPNPPTSANPYDWSYVDDAFAQVAAWNAQNPTKARKTIQLMVTPGFQTPQWVFDQIPSCDGLFQSPVQTPPSTCGKATFAGFTERADSTELPLPWNPFYKSCWNTFLTALAARYGSNPAFVSIAVAGPTAASEEMIVPNNANTPSQDQFGGIQPNAMWLQLLAFHYPALAAYQKSDQAFIDEWNAAIDLYAKIFSSVTLIATTGSGLPNLSRTGFTVPGAFSADCNDPDMDCAAETTILSHVVDPTVGGANAKATQTSGMEAARAGNLNLGVAGVKLISQNTATLPAPSAQILGGAQFNTSFSNDPVKEGCTSLFPPKPPLPAGCTSIPTCTTGTTYGCIPATCIPAACITGPLGGAMVFSDVPATSLTSPEQALYNVLNYFFDGTAVAASFGATQGTVPLNYLQVYSTDIQYAEAHVNAPALIVETGGASVSMSAQDLLDLASRKLLEIAEPLPSPVAITAAGNFFP